MKLLDELLYDRSFGLYLSSLKVPQIVLQNIDVIQRIPDDKYTLEEWKEAYFYIVGEPGYGLSIPRIKGKLETYVENWNSR
jgi:hypothetical protein